MENSFFFKLVHLKKMGCTPHFSFSFNTSSHYPLFLCPFLTPTTYITWTFFHSKTNNFYLKEIWTSTSSVMLERLLWASIHRVTLTWVEDFQFLKIFISITHSQTPTSPNKSTRAWTESLATWLLNVSSVSTKLLFMKL